MYQEKRPRRGAKRLGAAIAAVCTLLLLLGVWAVWNGAQAAMREQAAQSSARRCWMRRCSATLLRGHTRRAFPIWKKTMACRSTTAGLLSAMRRMHRTSCRSSPCWKSRRHDSLRRGIRQNEGRRRSEKTRSVLDASVSAASVCHHRAVAAVPCDDGDRLYSAVVDSQTRNRERARRCHILPRGCMRRTRRELFPLGKAPRARRCCCAWRRLHG